MCSAEELVLADALGLGDGVEINPSGGALAGNAVMVTGLARIGEAFKQVSDERQATGARACVLGPVPATEPRVRLGGDGSHG